MTAWTAIDHAMMARALQLAERGLFTTKPNPMVGCVIARKDKIIGEGFHARAGGLMCRGDETRRALCEQAARGGCAPGAMGQDIELVS